MHKLIGAVVYAADKEAAIHAAIEVFEALCGEDGQPFNWFTTFAEQFAIDRWGKYPVAMLSNSNKGEAFIAKAMERTKLRFDRHIAKLRGILTQSTSEAIYADSHGIFRYYCKELGIGGGLPFLYQVYGEEIHNEESLENVLSKWACLYEDKGKPNPHADDNIYVVPADVHY